MADPIAEALNSDIALEIACANNHAADIIEKKKTCRSAFRDTAVSLKASKDVTGSIAFWRLLLQSQIASEVGPEAIERQLAKCLEKRTDEEKNAAGEKTVGVFLSKAKELHLIATSLRYPFRASAMLLERAIAILSDLLTGHNDFEHCRYDTNKEQKLEISYLLGCCYLQRGQFILPTAVAGSVANRYRREAMLQGLKWLSLALQEASTNLVYLKTKAFLLRELFRMEENWQGELQTALKAVREPHDFKTVTPQDYQLLAWHCRLSGGTGEELQSIYSYHPSVSVEERYPWLPLLRAEAALGLFCQNKSKLNLLNSAAKIAVERLTMLSVYSQVWDDTLRLLQDMKSEEADCWSKLTRMMLGYFQEKTERQFEGLHIRQYWHCRRDLYQLAFLAAVKQGDLSGAVLIADATKSRIPQNWKQIEEALSLCDNPRDAPDKTAERKKLLQRYYDMEAMACQNMFVPEDQATKDALAALFQMPNPPPKPECIPVGWTVVHLFLTEEGDTLNCHLVSGAIKEGKIAWIHSEATDVPALVKTYEAWQDTYNRLQKNQKGPINDAAENLCLQIAKSLPLFDCLPPNPSGLLLIPHGFLHQLPLHAACRLLAGNDKEFLIEKAPILYLPSWSHMPAADQSATGTSGKYYLNNFNLKSEIQEEQEYFLDDKTQWNWTCIKEAGSSTDLDTWQAAWQSGQPPEWLVIHCHGEANIGQPLYSRLLLAESDLTYFDLQRKTLSLAGSKVVLGACETELARWRPEQPDEHLTFGGALLNKGAALVLGALWRIDKETTRSVMKEVIINVDGKPVWEVLQNEQIKLLKAPYGFYFGAPFRILGFPGSAASVASQTEVD